MSFEDIIQILIPTAQVMQVPLVLFIIILSYLAIKSLKITGQFWIGTGFVLNLIYIVCTVLSDEKSPFYPLVNIDKSLWVQQSIVFDILSSFSFFLAAIIFWIKRGCINGAQSYKGKLFKGLIVSTVLSILTIALIIVMISKSETSIPYGSWPVGLYHFSSLSLMVVFFYKAFKDSSTKKFLIIGFGLWASLQLLVFIPNGLMAEVYKNIIGFSISLFAKMMILFGLFNLYVNYAVQAAGEIEKEIQEKEKEKKEREHFENSSLFFEKILINTFHEILTPQRSLGKAIELLGSKVSKDGKDKYLEVVNYFERMKAVINASINSFRKENLDLTETQDESLPTPIFETRFGSINTQIEIAIRSIKNLFHENRKIEFVQHYGPKLFIDSNEASITQIFTNLFKNAREAYDLVLEEDQLGTVLIRSFLSKSKSDTDKNRYVIVEIEDYATGIQASILNDIWEWGFSTKNQDENYLQRGNGLAIVMDLMNKHEGSSISVESPIKSKAGIRMGTKFTLKFKYIKIKKKEK